MTTNTNIADGGLKNRYKVSLTHPLHTYLTVLENVRSNNADNQESIQQVQLNDYITIREEFVDQKESKNSTTGNIESDVSFQLSDNQTVNEVQSNSSPNLVEILPPKEIYDYITLSPTYENIDNDWKKIQREIKDEDIHGFNKDSNKLDSRNKKINILGRKSKVAAVVLVSPVVITAGLFILNKIQNNSALSEDLINNSTAKAEFQKTTSPYEVRSADDVVTIALPGSTLNLNLRTELFPPRDYSKNMLHILSNFSAVESYPYHCGLSGRINVINGEYWCVIENSSKIKVYSMTGEFQREIKSPVSLRDTSGVLPSDYADNKYKTVLMERKNTNGLTQVAQVSDDTVMIGTMSGLHLMTVKGQHLYMIAKGFFDCISVDVQRHDLQNTVEPSKEPNDSKKSILQNFTFTSREFRFTEYNGSAKSSTSSMSSATKYKPSMSSATKYKPLKDPPKAQTNDKSAVMKLNSKRQASSLKPCLATSAMAASVKINFSPNQAPYAKIVLLCSITNISQENLNNTNLGQLWKVSSSFNLLNIMLYEDGQLDVFTIHLNVRIGVWVCWSNIYAKKLFLFSFNGTKIREYTPTSMGKDTFGQFSLIYITGSSDASNSIYLCDMMDGIHILQVESGYWKHLKIEKVPWPIDIVTIQNNSVYVLGIPDGVVPKLYKLLRK